MRTRCLFPNLIAISSFTVLDTSYLRFTNVISLKILLVKLNKGLKYLG